MTLLAVSLGVTGAFFAGVLAASMLTLRPMWRRHPTLAPAYGLLGTAVLAHIGWVEYWGFRPLGVAMTCAVVIWVVITLARHRIWTSWRTWLPPAALGAGLTMAAVGFAFIRGVGPNPFETIETRIGTMPPDNVLQQIFADRLWHHQSTVSLLVDWHGSDRPPLQSGFILLARPLAALAGNSTTGIDATQAAVYFGFAASIVAQVAWLPAVWSFCRTLGWSVRLTALTVVFCASTPAIFNNVLYTWPKVLAGALVLAGTTLLIPFYRTTSLRIPARTAACACALFVLGYLSHGGVIYIAPLIVLMLPRVLRASTSSDVVRTTGLCVATAAVFYAPWQLYGTISDPFTGRLLKWYLGGHVEPTQDSLGHLIEKTYGQTPIGELIHIRLTNAMYLLDPGLLDRFNIIDGHWVADMRSSDFLRLPFALGWATILLLAMLACALRRGARSAPASAVVSLDRDQVAIRLVVGSLVSIAVWVLTLPFPDFAVVHVGSYTWILLLAAAPFAWFATRRPRWASLLVGWNLIHLYVVYQAPGEAVFHVPGVAVPTTLTPIGMIATVAGLAITAAALWWAWREPSHSAGLQLAPTPALENPRATF